MANKTSSIGLFADLVRIELPLAAGVCVLAGEVIGLGGTPAAAEAALGFLAGFLVSAAAMASNDIFDLEVDRVNAPERPLPSGTMSVRSVAALAAVLSLAGLAVAALLGLMPLVTAAVILAVGLAYNWKGKEFGLAGNMMVALSVAMSFIFGGLAVGAAGEPMVWAFGVMAFLFDLGEEIANGVLDAEGDAKRGARSLARTRGRNFAVNASGTCFIAIVIVSFLPYVLGWAPVAYLAMVAVVDVALIVLHTRFRFAMGREEGKRAVRLLYLVMLAFVIAFTALRGIGMI
jgi:geranylgeranylglycerol-phosphate geranylgeranyltransferase